MLVSGWQQALTLVAVLIPGFIFQGVLRNRVGPSPDDRNLSIRLIRSLAWSIFFLLVYFVVFGITITDLIVEPEGLFRDRDPRLMSTLAVALIFVIPFLTGYIYSAAMARVSLNDRGLWARAKGDELTWRDALFTNKSGYSPIPTAWDYAVGRISPGDFVRVLTDAGNWIGGRALSEAYFTSYPEDREVFLEEAWSLDGEGAFVELIPNTQGLWIRCDDVALLQVLAPSDISSISSDTDCAQDVETGAEGQDVGHTGDTDELEVRHGQN